MEVLLTHGYFIEEDEKEQAIMKPYPPLGILCISAYLEQHTIENEVFDTTFSSKEKLFAHLVKNKPKYVGLYVNLMTKLNILKIIDFIKKELPETIVFAGGPDVRYNAENLLRYGANFCVIGEGEATSLELIQHLKEAKDTNFLMGIAYINQEGKFIQNAERPLINDLDTLPRPNRYKVDLPLYLNAWKQRHGKNAISMSTMRGCPYTCKWCSRAVYGMSYRRRTPQSVVAEMLDVKQTYNPDTIWFVDDVFSINVRWLKQFREEVEKHDCVIPYECITRADKMNEAVIKDLKASGCFRVWIGAESGSQKVVDLMKRRVSVERTREMIQLAKKHGIEAGTFIMLGYPGETEEDIEETIHHLKTADPDFFTMTVAYPIKGTELYQEVEAKQTAKLNWQDSTDRDIDFERTYPRKYYDYAIRRVYNEVHAYQATNPLKALNHKVRSIGAKIGMRINR